MKNIRKILIITLLCLFYRQNAVCPQSVKLRPAIIVYAYIPFAPKYGAIHIDAFRQKLGKMESGNDYNCKNTFGYFGKYQFGKQAMKHFGFTKSDLSDTTKILGYTLTRGMLNQEILLSNMLAYHSKHLKIYFKYIGKIVNGVKITKNGILSSAQLLGDGGVRNFFRGILDKDGYGVTAIKYFKAFEHDS
jgi:hypothetical protein